MATRERREAVGIHASFRLLARLQTKVGIAVWVIVANQENVTIGAQVDISIAVLSALELMVSAGAGIAVEEGRPARREVMLSLKVLR